MSPGVKDDRWGGPRRAAMTRWIWKRWVWAVLIGGVIVAQPGKPSPADGTKSGDTITIKFAGQPDRKVTVVKTTRKPDGSVETTVKDPKTGETFTLTDPAPGGGAPPAGPKSMPGSRQLWPSGDPGPRSPEK